jgi:hypothetical protein
VKRLVALFAAAVLFAGCTGAVPGEDVSGNLLNTVKYVHDDAHHVACWVSYGSTGNMSIFCLPDSQVYQP